MYKVITQMLLCNCYLISYSVYLFPSFYLLFFSPTQFWITIPKFRSSCSCGDVWSKEISCGLVKSFSYPFAKRQLSTVVFSSLFINCVDNSFHFSMRFREVQKQCHRTFIAVKSSHNHAFQVFPSTCVWLGCR